MKVSVKSELALLGGPKAVSAPLPHEIWPPPALQDELDELRDQRNKDISIRGRSGPIAELEALFLQFMENEVEYAVTFNSGTSALLAAYFALGVDEDDEVIGPALTYHAALSPAYTLKANVKLADIDVDSRCLRVDEIERLITPRTKVITVVHQWGHPADMDAIMKLARERRLSVLEDCSHAHGSRYKGRLCGTFGDVAVFSLQTNKMIFAGEGGILVTNSEILNDRAVLLGHYRDRPKQEIRDPARWSYWVTGFGLKLRMSPFNAIVAKHSLANYAKVRAGRHRCLRYLNERLAETRSIRPISIADYADMGAWYGFKPLYDSQALGGLSRERLIDALRAEGVEISNPSAPTLSTQPLYRDAPDLMFPRREGKVSNDPRSTPNAVQVERTALSLPTFYDWDQDRPIIDGYLDAIAKVERCYEELLET